MIKGFIAGLALYQSLSISTYCAFWLMIFSDPSEDGFEINIEVSGEIGIQK
jgi:hypothetical protein